MEEKHRITGIEIIKSVAECIDQFDKLNIVVIGDIMLDRYVRGSTTRISPEAPVPVLSYGSEESMLGGAGNVAHNLAVLGVKVSLLGIVGEDERGREVLKLAQEQGIDCTGIVELGDMSTTYKERIISDGQHIVRVDHEARERRKTYPAENLKSLEEKAERCDAIIVSDYLKGVLTEEVIETLMKIAKKHAVPVVVDTKPANIFFYKGATLFTPNDKEAVEAVGIPDPIEAAYVLAQKCEAAVLVTQGPKGATLIEGDEEIHFPAKVKEVVDVSGAGDTVTAVAGAVTAAGGSLKEAAHLSNIAGGIVVTKSGTASVSRSELLDALSKKMPSSSKLQSENNLQKRIATERADGRTIVFTNGCFDILHRGHIECLEEAKKQGDFLIVAVNSDESVRNLKGPQRPVNALEDRVSVIAALSCVDAVISFTEPTVAGLLNMIKPDVYVKGGDYTLEELRDTEAKIVEECGGKIHVTAKTEDRSTTKLIAKVLEIHRANVKS